MKILSLNVRGLGATSKKNALKRLLANTRPTILLLQETMTEGRKAEEIIKEFLGDWEMERIDAEGHSGGTLIAMNPTVRIIYVNHYGSTLGTEVEDSEMGKHFCILNMYGPFYDRKEF